MLVSFPALQYCAADYYNLEFSSYFGGSDIEHARDVVSDKKGNIYIAGGTASTDFPVTAGAFDETRDGGGNSRGEYDFDAFVAKFDSTGELLWCTYLGGPNYDRIYAIEVDDSGYVYVAGRAGEGFPTTAGSFQPAFNGSFEGNAYGSQNGFVAKLSPDGSTLIWASYAGVGWLCRDIAIDADGDVYVNSPYPASSHLPPAAWFANAFQPDVNGLDENGILKIKGDGSAVIWATWIGGSGADHGQSTIRVDAAKNVYINFMTESTDIPTTQGAHDRTIGGTQDGFVAKFSPDGSQLLFGTYVGGSGTEYMETHGLALDGEGNVYSVFATTSTDFPTTPNAFDSTLDGTVDIGLVKLSPSGQLIAGTLIGGGGSDGPDGIYVDAAGNVIIGGETNSPDFPVTADAFLSSLGGTRDGLLVNLSSDFSTLNYSSYFGGPAEDNVRGMFMGNGGNIYITGSSNGTGLPVLNPFQTNYGGGSGGCCAIGDAFVARFSMGPSLGVRGPLVHGVSSQPFKIQASSKGRVEIIHNSFSNDRASLTIYDMRGKRVPQTQPVLSKTPPSVQMTE